MSKQKQKKCFFQLHVQDFNFFLSFARLLFCYALLQFVRAAFIFLLRQKVIFFVYVVRT
jgi:hypothetical protein